MSECLYCVTLPPYNHAQLAALWLCCQDFLPGSLSSSQQTEPPSKTKWSTPPGTEVLCVTSEREGLRLIWQTEYFYPTVQSPDVPPSIVKTYFQIQSAGRKRRQRAQCLSLESSRQTYVQPQKQSPKPELKGKRNASGHTHRATLRSPKPHNSAPVLVSNPGCRFTERL